MSFREIGKAVLGSEPCRSVLTGIGRWPSGRKVLNRFNSCGVFATIAEADSAAKRASVFGHEDPEEVEVHLRLAQSLRPSDYAVLFWLLKIGGEDLRIFDYGGSIGNLYYSYRPYLLERENVDWRVFDIPSVIEKGMEIALERKAARLTFVNSAAGVSRQTILLISGAFHYWEGSVQEFLAQFAEPPEHIILNRSPIHETLGPFITVQRTGTCAFPCVVRNKAELISDFRAMGYVLMDQWKALELGLTLPFFPDQSVPYYSGFYFHLENPSVEK